jgi:uncharacterized OsmC-like protein
MAEEEKIVNGISVTALFNTIDAVKDNPAIAEFEFRAENAWHNGGHNRTAIKDFSGALELHKHGEDFVLDADEHPVLLGTDKGPNPVEYALTALAGCVTTTIVYHAAAKGIDIRGVKSRLEGSLDLRGFLGLSQEVPVGFREIRMYITIDADISDKEKAELIGIGQQLSPVFNTITNVTSISVQLDPQAGKAVAA